MHSLIRAGVLLLGVAGLLYIYRLTEHAPPSRETHDFDCKRTR
jgi:hypothetical protein